MKDSPGWLARHVLPGNVARTALITYGVIAAAATAVALVESYTNLYDFAVTHLLFGWRARVAPLDVDSFIVMGELLLFAGLIRGWKRIALAGCVMTVCGFLASAAGNIWHARDAIPVDRLVAVIFPVTAAAGLAAGLAIVRQVMTSGGSHPPRLTGTRLSSPGPAARDAEPLPEVRSAGGAARRARGPVVAVDEAALLTELLTREGPLPPYRAWSFEKTGKYRAASTRRAYDQARAALNGAGAVNGAGHGNGED